MFKPILFILSILYRFGVQVRNSLFDMDLIKQHEFDIPVISVGNITVGGTGKTPHVEYLISILQDKYDIAVISRGYKRTSKGHQEVLSDSSPQFSGDEPLQLKQKFPNCLVVVNSNRVDAITKIMKKGKMPDLIILDDAYQHRYVKPGLNILITDFNRLITEDTMLPHGRLREPISQTKRADIIIVSKCPDNLKPIDERILYNRLNTKPFQTLFFTNIKYNDYKPTFADFSGSIETLTPKKDSTVVLVTGIANPSPLIKQLKEEVKTVIVLSYSDHHNYSSSDIAQICKTFEEIKDENKVIITTEKDMVKFASMPNCPELLRDNMLYKEIEIKFHDSAEQFNQQVIRYVQGNKGNFKLNRVKRH